jgi:LmbE family N-acetylglucosaminyl deacetylase
MRTTEPLKLMALLAHPDDESLGFGGALARYAAEGVEVSLVMATRGERGWTGPAESNPGPAALGRLREAELAAAADVLGVREVAYLDYIDGDLDRAEPTEAIGRIVGHLRRFRPQVVLTFAPDGAYGHPDHIAICQLTTAAVLAAADAAVAPEAGPPHRVAKLYYRAFSQAEIDLYELAFGRIAMTIDGIERACVAWPDWAISASIDASDEWQRVRRAAACHRSQVPPGGPLERLSPEQHRLLWGMQDYYRAMSLVNGGRVRETDLFAGLRQPDSARALSGD